jgi:hypothetical protein
LEQITPSSMKRRSRQAFSQLVTDRQQELRPAHRRKHLAGRRADERDAMITAAGEMHDRPVITLGIVVGGARVSEEGQQLELDPRERPLRLGRLQRHDSEVEPFCRERGRHGAHLAGQRQRSVAIEPVTYDGDDVHVTAAGDEVAHDRRGVQVGPDQVAAEHPPQHLDTGSQVPVAGRVEPADRRRTAAYRRPRAGQLEITVLETTVKEMV